MKKSNWGGHRPGAGRPSTNRPHTICVKCADDVYQILNNQPSKSAYIEQAIRFYNQNNNKS